MKRVKKGGIEAACQAALGALVLAALGSLGYSAAWAAAPPHGAAASAPADPCQDHDKWVQYHVAAIDVEMVLNRFGDRNDDAFMYVGAKNSEHELEIKIQAVRTWAERSGCTSWDPPGKHEPCVSTGLRNDLVQPLVLRANLGQCLVIHFTNRLDPIKKRSDLSRRRTWPNDGKASLDVSGLAYSVEKDGVPVPPTDTFADTRDKLTYKIPLPADPAAERAYYFQEGEGNRQRVAHGLFGVIVAEPAGSEYLDPKTGTPSDGTGWEAIIKVPDVPDPQRDFREFVVIYHEIGDENYAGIIDGTKDNKATLPQIIDAGQFPALELVYRPGGRALNYRSEPFLQRLAIKGDNTDSTKSPFAKKKALAYSSYTFGDPATPIPRSYLGEPTKTRLVHGGSEVFHVHHLHGGGDRWRRNPKADPNNDIASGLNKRPKQDVFSTHLDSQTIGPGTSYNLEHECGAGGCQQAAGDFLFHCHIGHHYIGGMWGLWRVFDTEQEDLAKLPDMPRDMAPPKAVDSTQLVGKKFGGKEVKENADPNNPAEVSVQEWVESQLPPKGHQLDCDDDEVKVTDPGKPPQCDDATVWNWVKKGLLYLGEPEITEKEKWANYESKTPGQRPPILFNPINGRYAWPLFRPHLGQRPPFAPNGHSGSPWLGEHGSKDRPDGLCPDPKEWSIPSQTIRHYPISAVPMDISRNEAVDSKGKPIIDIDDKGKLFVLNEDIRGETPEGKVLLDNSKTIEPLVIRSNVGDCVRVIFTSKLQPNEDKTASKVNMHTHFVQFDPQASDGVITGFSYEQSVRPYSTERRSEEAPEGAANEKKVRRLEKAVSPGAKEIVVNQTFRLREGIWIGVGLGEGICDATNACCAPQGDTLTPRTEIRRITGITENPGLDANARTYTIKLDQSLRLPHEKEEAVGVEFVQYNWYSDVDTGTVFWHDHVEFSSWGHGLASAHVIEPAGSTWHDPKTGKPVRRGAIADIHTPPDASVGAGQKGSFREFVLLNIKQELNVDETVRDGFGLRKATINLRNEPIVDPRSITVPATGRNGAPAYWFSSVTHGDPATPLPRAYVGDPFVIRHLGVLDREGGIRLTGHRFRIERFAEPGAFSDGSPIGISERYDLVLDGGAGGPLGKPGDFLYYNTLGRDMLGGAWGLIRVHDTLQEGQMPLMPLPDRSPPSGGKGFPSQTPAPGGDNSGPPPLAAPDNVNTCPKGTLPPKPNDVKDVEIRQTPILRQARLGDLSTHPELTVKDGIAFTLKDQAEEYTLKPLVLRVNEGECLKVTLTNKLPAPDPKKQDHQRAGWHVGELLFDPQSSHASAIGLNRDSTVLPNGTRTYYYYADRELGTTLALNLANPPTAGKGAFGAVIVEPPGSSYQDPVTGKPVKSGVFADIVAPVREEGLSGLFREIVTLFHDSDPNIGHNDMEYPWEAHCNPAGNFGVGCKRDFPDPPDPLSDSFFKGFTSISYKLNRWSDRKNECTLGNPDCTPSEVYSSKHGDPGLVIAGTPGLALMFRVAAPWGEQLHSFSLSGHRWRLEPAMHESEQVFAHMLAPGYSFDVPVIGGFGGDYGITGDFLFRDGRMPFAQAGLWGLIRVTK